MLLKYERTYSWVLYVYLRNNNYSMHVYKYKETPIMPGASMSNILGCNQTVKDVVKWNEKIMQDKWNLILHKEWKIPSFQIIDKMK